MLRHENATVMRMPAAYKGCSNQHSRGVSRSLDVKWAVSPASVPFNSRLWFTAAFLLFIAAPQLQHRPCQMTGMQDLNDSFLWSRGRLITVCCLGNIFVTRVTGMIHGLK
jgi:hypothetical protein